MTSPLHKSAIAARLKRFLDRRTMPKALDGKPQAQADELAALVATISRYAPLELADWWGDFEADVGERNTTRSWPSEGEIAASCKAVSKPNIARPAQGTEIDAVAVNAERINRGDPVGDAWLWGRNAVALLQSKLVTMADLRAYRSAIFFSEKTVCGEDEALRREDERNSRHHAAEEIDGHKSVHVLSIPDKRSVPEWQE